MITFNNFQEIAIYIINHMAEIFRNSAVLKGGMVLNLLGSPRFTNDIDYIFIPYKSKNEVKDLILRELKTFLDCEITYSLNSKCLRYYINYSEKIKLQMEVNVSEKCETEELSTMDISRKNNQTGQIIIVMSYKVALAHKIAAWNERELIRDLYDIYYYMTYLNEYPDMEIINKRLNKAQKRNKKIHMTLEQLIEKLRLCVSSLTAEKIENELRDYLSGEELTGLDKKIIISINKLIHYFSK